jgi:hypothetical protein
LFAIIAVEEIMAGSLIEELQRDAINSTISVSDLLRKALLVASKLDIPGVPEWIDKELSGYDLADEVPPYRMLRGRVMLRTYQGWRPVQFPTTEFERKVAEQPLKQSVAGIEKLISGKGELRWNFPPESQEALQHIFQYETEFTCMSTRASVAAILDEVKNRILRWSMALDRAGVRGDGLTFTQEEKVAAHSIVVHGDMNLGVLGDVNSAANVAAGDHAHAGNVSSKEIRELVAEIEPHVEAVSLAAGDKDALRTAIADLQKASASEHVEAVKVRQILSRVLGTAGKIGDHVLAAGIKVVVEGWMKAHGMVP